MSLLRCYKLRGRTQDPWLVVGNFNEVLNEADVRGGEFVACRAELFYNCIDHCELIDIGAIDSNFTWHRSLHGILTIWKKLDRVVADWRQRVKFPNACVKVLLRIYSDHNLLLLRMGGFPQAHGPKPFRFQAAWVYQEDYHHVVSQPWNKGDNGVVDGLRRVKDDSIIFNKEVFSNIFLRK